jgi:hypothetical protein
MSEDKYVVPKRMLKAAIAQALIAGKVMKRRQWTEFFSSHDSGCVQFTTQILEAALRWQAENLIKATDEQVKQIVLVCGLSAGWEQAVRDIVAEWQRIAFRELEPEVPQEIADLIQPSVQCEDPKSRWTNGEDVKRIAIEAFRRGRESNKEKH